MKLSLILVLYIFCNYVFAASLCSLNKSEIEGRDIHYILPEKEKKQENIHYEIDLTAVSDMKVELNLIGFENEEGGNQVLSDLEIARVRLEQILSSRSFKLEVENHKYKNKLQFKKNDNKSNSDIYILIQDGADEFNSEVDNTVDMVLCPYYSSKNVIGKTYSNRKEVWVNLKYYRDRYNDFKISDMVGNILHEWIHNVGFGHASRYNRSRLYTVPYGVGYIARDIAKYLD